jgi:hypothetical protein
MGTWSEKWYIWVVKQPGENDDDALAREAARLGITVEEIGYAIVFQEEGTKSLDFGGHDGPETLRGWKSLEERLVEMIRGNAP